MTPVFHAIKIHTNNRMENPTRMAKARAIRLDLDGAFWPPRIMKNKAAARLPKMTTKASTTRYDITGIIL